jgi:signal transduction histidine kinase
MYEENSLVLAYDQNKIVDEIHDEYMYKRDIKDIHRYRVLYRVVEIENKPYLLMCRIPMMDIFDFFKVQIAQHILMIIALIISLIIIHRFTTKKTWAPFYDTLEKIEHYNITHSNVPEFTPTNIKEFSRLNRIVATLISKDLIAYRKQKEFVENASHELLTPLAILKARLDTVIQYPNLTENQIELLRSLYSIAARLIRMNKNLLLLAKIDNDYFNDLQDVNLVEVLNSSLSYFNYQSENVRIRVSINNPLIVKANKSLLENLVNNLIANGILHNIEREGTITITVENNTFTVSNTSYNEALNLDQAYKRFNRTTNEKKGNGLGLSIVYQICLFHKWKLEYQFNQYIHSFTVHFN